MCWTLPLRGISEAFPALLSAPGTSLRVFPKVSASFLCLVADGYRLRRAQPHALPCCRSGTPCQDASDFGHLPPDALTWMRCVETLSTFPPEGKLLMASAAAAQIIIQSRQLECGYFFNDAPCLGCAAGSLVTPRRSHSGYSATEEPARRTRAPSAPPRALGAGSPRSRSSATCAADTVPPQVVPHANAAFQKEPFKAASPLHAFWQGEMLFKAFALKKLFFNYFFLNVGVQSQSEASTRFSVTHSSNELG